MEKIENNTSILSVISIKLKAIYNNLTLRYILKRVLSSIITLLLLVAIITALLRLIPDEKLYNIDTYNKLNAQAGLQAAERYRIAQLFTYGRVTLEGKRIPVIQNILQYIHYLLPVYKEIPYRWDNRYLEVKAYWKGFIYLGRSIEEAEFLIDIIKDRVGISFIISILSVFFTYLIGVPFGIAMAKRPGGIIDKLGSIFIVLNYAIPALVFYLIMNAVMGDKNGPFGFLNFGFFYEKGNPKTLIIPIFCIVFLSLPGIIIWIRRFMVDELNSDYVKFARSKGLSENKIMYTHVLRNACVPLIRNIPATFISSIIGSYFIEAIWGINGTGRLLTNSLNKTDVPAIQGLVILYAAMSMLAFLLGDIITAIFDPRIKLGGVS